ncbi:MAG: hypothetical protein AAFY00_01280, partial [Bacteroidota bacterium]
MKNISLLGLIFGFVLLGYGQDETIQNTSTSFYKDVTKTHLPYEDLQLLSMDAGIGDIDEDGDMDILIANEHRPNILLIN